MTSMMRPPNNKRRRISLGSDSVVEHVLQRLAHSERQNISEELQQRAQEMLRLLTVKVEMGRLGKKDSRESRAAVVLEHVARQEGTRLSIKKLASSVGLKQAAFEALQTKVGNYLVVQSSPTEARGGNKSASSSSARRTGKGLKRPNSSSMARSARTLRSNATWESTIPALSIRLGPLVQDSHGFARQAQGLLEDLQEYVNSLNNIYDKHGYLSDMQQYRAAYEAACFYVVARPAAKSKSRSSTSNDNNMEDGELAERHLEKQHVIDASSVSRIQFDTILRAVEKLREEVREKNCGEMQERDKRLAAPRREPSRQQQSGNGQQEEASVSTDSAGTRSVLDRVAEGSEESPCPQEQTMDVDARLPYLFSEAFLTWKANALSKACEEARQAIHIEFDAAETSGVSKSRALQLAADAVLERNLLVP